MDEIKSPLKAIKQFCYECNGESYTAVKECTSARCPLKPFRLGKNPFTKRREMTEEERQAARERLAKARSNKQK